MLLLPGPTAVRCLVVLLDIASDVVDVRPLDKPEFSLALECVDGDHLIVGEARRGRERNGRRWPSDQLDPVFQGERRPIVIPHRQGHPSSCTSRQGWKQAVKSIRIYLAGPHPPSA